MKKVMLPFGDAQLDQSSYPARISALVDDGGPRFSQDVFEPHTLHHDAAQLNVAFPENSFGGQCFGMEYDVRWNNHPAPSQFTAFGECLGEVLDSRSGQVDRAMNNQVHGQFPQCGTVAHDQ